jgi:3-dehydroquinate dehydratase-2
VGVDAVQRSGVDSKRANMTKPIYVLNGPNLNRLGKREPEIYGTTTLAEVEALCRKAAGRVALEFRQTNAESQLIDWIHEAIDHGAGIIINPAGFTFTSVPIMDALKMFDGPVFELHISNIHRRDAVYQHSLVSKVATAVIAGLGADGYATAVEAMVRRLKV